jgi:nickel superoxide dismutase
VIAPARRLTMGSNAKMSAIGIAMALIWAIMPALPASSHCEIPCGIYGDETRFVMMREDIATIEKSMKQVMELSKEAKPNYNQIVRWVENKEHHADKIRDVVTQYFMAQRVKPVPPKESEEHRAYVERLTLLHLMIVHSMKCKQTTDLAHVEKLKELVDLFEKAYFGK